MSGQACVVCHGGAGHDEKHRDICERACDAAVQTLQAGGSARAAAIAAVQVLEDAPELNAGTGAVLRVDGRTVQCDAAVMDAVGFGAVAAVEGIKNPVLLAEAVYALPHLLVVGEGAGLLADQLGLERAELLTEQRRAQHVQRMATRAAGSQGADAGIDEIFRLAATQGNACDTVGAVVRDSQGRLAGAGSTGGLWCALAGRVGDTPIPGAGIEVSERAAVCATGVGETIWRHRLSSRAHEALDAGATSEALEHVLTSMEGLGEGIDLGLIAIGPGGGGAACTRRMPWAMWEGEL